VARTSVICFALAAPPTFLDHGPGLSPRLPLTATIDFDKSVRTAWMRANRCGWGERWHGLA